MERSEAAVIDLGRLDARALATTWAAAAPFPHLVLDDVVVEADLEALRAAAAIEPLYLERSELVDARGSAPTPWHPTLAALAAALATPATLAAVGAISGRAVTRVEARSYLYLPGHYLLPHTDSGLGLGRQVAFTLYLGPHAEVAGGELELFRCTLVRGELTAAAPAVRIPYRSGRLVLFEVSDRSLHQVREVTAGDRRSVAGWFS